MTISGAGVDSAECRELRAKLRDRISQHDNLPALLKFDVEDAFIDFETRDQTCVPSLVLMGRPTGFEGDFPWDVGKVEYANTLDRRLLAYRYEFTRANLAELSMKGLFEEGFEVPEVIRKNEFELPCTVSCVSIGPEGQNDFPVVFTSVNPGSLRCNDDTSGYTISEYFETMPAKPFEDEHEMAPAMARTLVYNVAYARVRDGASAALDVEQIIKDAEAEKAARQAEAAFGESGIEPEPGAFGPDGPDDGYEDDGYEDDGLGADIPEEEFEPPEAPEDPESGRRTDRSAGLDLVPGGDSGYMTLGDDEYE